MTLGFLSEIFVHYKYIAIFPIAVIEGPIISIIAGFLVSRGVLSFLGAFIAVFLGDFISDSFFYFIGRKGKPFIKKIKFVRITDEQLSRIEAQYDRSPWKTMIVAKISYGLGMPFMASVGLSKMSVPKFMTMMGFLNALRSLVLLLSGYYFGRIAIHLGKKYFSYYVLAVIILVPLVWYVVKKVRKK